MTKNAPAPKTVAPVAASVTYEDLPLPPRTHSGGNASELMTKLAGCPQGKSFLEPVIVPDTIKDADERQKVFKEEARKLSNRVSGTIRRFRKTAESANREFAIRTVNDDTQGRGVRVFRIDGTDKG